MQLLYILKAHKTLIITRFLKKTRIFKKNNYLYNIRLNGQDFEGEM